jgi:hypothetical protein
VDTAADFTGTALDETFNATMATMQSLDVVEGGLGKDTLIIRDTASITSRSGAHTGFEVLTVESTAGSVGQVAAAATIAAKQQQVYEFSTTAGTSVGSGQIVVTVGGVARTIGTAGTATTVNAITNAIESILDEAFGTPTNASNWVVDDTGANSATATTGKITVTANVAGTALPSISIAGATLNTTFDSTAASGQKYLTTVQANQKAADAVASSTFSVMADVTTATVTAATTANVSSVSTAATTVAAGGAVVLSGGASQAVTTADSVQVSGGVGAVSVTALAAPSTALAAVTGTGFGGGAGVFVRGGTTVSITETAGSSSAGAAPAGNASTIQVGANPSSSTAGTAGANSGARVSNAVTGAEVIGNLSSAPTGDLVSVVRTTYTGTNGLTNVAYGTGAVTAFMNGGSTASVTGAGTVSITDLQTTLIKASTTADALPGTSKLTTVNLTGVTDTTAIKSDAIATISAVDTTSVITVTSNVGANTGGVALNVANSTVTLAHANATSVSVGGAAGSGRQSVGETLVAVNQGSTVTLGAAKATTVAFAGANNVVLAASNATGADLSAMTTITSTASGQVTFNGTLTAYSALTSVNLDASTGGSVATIGATIDGTAATDRAFSYTGGSGADVVTIAGTLRSGTNARGDAVANTISLGGGNDVVLNGGSGVIGTGATVAGGDGADLIAASLLNAGNATRVTGFEILGLDRGASSTTDTDLLTGATGLALLVSGGTYTNVEKAQSLSVGVAKGTSANTTETVISFTAAQVAGATDAYAVAFAGTGDRLVSTNPSNVDAGILTVEGIESLTIASGTASGFADNLINVKTTTLETVAITGASSLDLAFETGTGGATLGLGVSSIDASALTGKLVLSTANVTTATAGMTVKGGSASDTITLANSQIVTVNAGAGDDSIITGHSGVQTITTGAGKDTVDVSLSVVQSAASNTSSMIVITDAAAGDTIDFLAAANSGNAAALGSATSIASATTLDEALNAIANAVGTGPKWAVYGGNTYIVYDATDAGTVSSPSTTGVDAGDTVVRFDGVLDLSTWLLNATGGALTIA